MIAYHPDLAGIWHPLVVALDGPPPCGAALLLDAERYSSPDGAPVCDGCADVAAAWIRASTPAPAGPQPEDLAADQPT